MQDNSENTQGEHPDHAASEANPEEVCPTPKTTEVSGSNIEAPALSPMGQKSAQPFYARNPLTVGFCLLLVMVYGLTTFNTEFKGPSDLILALGGFYAPFIQEGQWWRFITATLLHANPGHLFSNVIGLLIFGNLLEPVLGSRRLGILYMISILSGLGMVFLMSPKMLVVGASTIFYGLTGAYLSLILILRYRYSRESFAKEFRSGVMFVLLFISWNILESATVSLWGHIGGLLGGIVFALWLVYGRKKITA